MMRIGVSVLNQRMANSADPHEMAHYEASHLDLHYWHRYLVYSAELKSLILIYTLINHLLESKETN